MIHHISALGQWVRHSHRIHIPVHTNTNLAEFRVALTAEGFGSENGHESFYEQEMSMDTGTDADNMDTGDEKEQEKEKVDTGKYYDGHLKGPGHPAWEEMRQVAFEEGHVIEFNNRTKHCVSGERVKQKQKQNSSDGDDDSRFTTAGIKDASI